MNKQSKDYRLTDKRLSIIQGYFAIIKIRESKNQDKIIIEIPFAKTTDITNMVKALTED